MPKSICILGAGKLSECVIDLIINENMYSHIFIFDDTKNSIVIGNKTLKVKGSINDGKQSIIKKKCDYFVSLGINNRELAIMIMNDLKAIVKEPVNIISKFSHISKSAKLGRNCIIFPGVVIGCNVTIGDLLICYSNASIEHHINMENGVVICPKVGIASNVSIGNYSFVGIGAIVSNNINIGDNCVIGAGAVVISSIKKSHLAFGNPAKAKFVAKKIRL
jgi:sugar O-acyltransferase (sialic acid O-acetyltransferase NeuD family)